MSEARLPSLGLPTGEWLPAFHENSVGKKAPIRHTTGQKQQLFCCGIYLSSFCCGLVAMIEELSRFPHVFVAGLLCGHNILACHKHDQYFFPVALEQKPTGIMQL